MCVFKWNDINASTYNYILKDTCIGVYIRSCLSALQHLRPYGNKASLSLYIYILPYTLADILGLCLFRSHPKVELNPQPLVYKIYKVRSLTTMHVETSGVINSYKPGILFMGQRQITPDYPNDSDGKIHLSTMG